MHIAVTSNSDTLLEAVKAIWAAEKWKDYFCTLGGLFLLVGMPNIYILQLELFFL